MAQALAPHVPHPVEDRTQPVELPGLAPGVELLGQYEGSGFQEAAYLVRRPDGQVIQVSELIYLVAAAIHDGGDLTVVAARVSAEYGREVSPDNVTYLVDKKLCPTGLLGTSSEGEKASSAPVNPLLALRLRLPLVPERIHRVGTAILLPLFWPPIIVAVLLALLVFDAWLVLELGTGVVLAAQSVFYTPQLFLPITLLTIVMGAFHEMGHAAAARYGGAKPGAMGAGIYLVWPVFYTDVTDSYRLSRRGRLRTDLGGVYFNAIFMVAIGAAYLATGHVLFLVFLLLAHLETLRQFLPIIRLDGFYILSDLAGVPNLFRYMGPALARATRGLRRGSQRHAARSSELDALTRRARIMLIAWATITAPILAVNVIMISVFLPRFAGAAWGSAGIQLGEMRRSLAGFEPTGVLSAALSIVFLAIPVVGMVYISYLIVKRLAPKVPEWRRSYPVVTGTGLAIVGLAMLAQVTLVWPSTFANAASEPGRQQAEAAAAETGAEARSALGRGLRAATGVVGMGRPPSIPESLAATPVPPLAGATREGELLDAPPAGPPTGADPVGPAPGEGEPLAGDAGAAPADEPGPSQAGASGRAAGPGQAGAGSATAPAPPATAPGDDRATRSDATGEQPADEGERREDGLITQLRDLVGGLLGE